MLNPSDDYEWWWIDMGYGCGGVRTVGGQIHQGGAPIFNKLVGYHLHDLRLRHGGRPTILPLELEPFVPLHQTNL